MEIDILGCTYKVTLRKLKKGVHGYCDHTDKEICLSTRYPETYRDTLVHEVLHGIFFRSGLCFMLMDNLEESIVTAIEHGLMNAGFIKELEEDVHRLLAECEDQHEEGRSI